MILQSWRTTDINAKWTRSGEVCIPNDPSHNTLIFPINRVEKLLLSGANTNFKSVRDIKSQNMGVII